MKDNQWTEYLDEGKQVSRAIEPRETRDVQGALRAKYPNVPLPTHKRVRTFSDKQRKAIGRN
jgi:hypothetical protein